MEKFKITDTYLITTDFDLDNIGSSTFIYCYGPLIGSTAFHIYVLLLLESRNNFVKNITFPIERITRSSDITIKEFNESLVTLQKYKLLKIFLNKSKKNNYHFELLKPLSYKTFSNSVLRNALQNKVGIENMKFNELRFNNNKKSNFDLEEITEETIIKKTENIITIDKSHKKLYELLKKESIDISFINEKFIKEIEMLINVYHLDILDISKIIKDLIKQKDLSLQSFKTKIKSLKLDIDKPTTKEDQKLELMKKISPKEFITLHFDRKPLMTEMSLINYLSKDLKLDNSIINTLIDYSLIKNDSIVINYVKKIATSIVQKKLTTFDEVINYLKTAVKLSGALKTNNKYQTIKQNSKEERKTEVDSTLEKIKF